MKQPIKKVLKQWIKRFVLAPFRRGSADGGRTYYSKHLGRSIAVSPGVFRPHEAEKFVLPFMKANPSFFKDKTVLEIGTGSGIISLYAAHLGANRVVATDILSAALAGVELNRDRSNPAAIETRQVPASDISAYSVVRSDERFDTIISNPPYTLDLDAAENSFSIDTGGLGPSILQGLRDHLNHGGVAALLYRSLFYQQFMVKYARHLKLQVEFDEADYLTSWEFEILANNYLTRVAPRFGISPEELRFDSQKDWHKLDILAVKRGRNRARREFPGMIVATVPT